MKKILSALSLIAFLGSSSDSFANFDNYVSNKVKQNFEKAWDDNKSLDSYGYNKASFAKFIGEAYKGIHDNYIPGTSYDELFLASLESMQKFVPDLTLDKTKSRMLIYKGYDLLGTFPLPDVLSEKDISLGYAKIFATAVDYAKKYSKDLKRAGNDELSYIVLNYVLKTLDRNALYKTEFDVSTSKDRKDKNYRKSAYSFGFNYRMVDAGIQLVNISMNPNMVAQGVAEGDLIVSINDIPLKGMSQQKVEKLLSLDEMKTYKLSYYSYSTREPRDIYITNYKVNLSLLQADFTDGILTLHLNSFVKGVSDDFYETVNSYLSRDDIKGMIVDLRGSVFGNKDEALKLIDMFYSEGVIAVLENKKNNGDFEVIENDIITDKNLNMGDLPFVIISDRSVSGAGEMFAQSMQIGMKAFIVGEASDGEGRIYNEFELSNKSVLSLPDTAFYSNDNVLNGVGVFPLICSYDIISDDDIEKLFNSIKGGMYEPYPGDIWFSKYDDLALNRADALREGCPYKTNVSYELDARLARKIVSDTDVYDFLMGVMLSKFNKED
ncbi:MAG: S41 family peptidase [Alphaproteobacteria bacterium]|nr:S41 family peptidase [Alphaproteobacteria bacterium]